MEKLKFKPGDRVTVVFMKNEDKNPHINIGDTGTVLSNPFPLTMGKVVQYRCYVEFDHYINGHSAGGLGKWGYCWNLNEDSLASVGTCSEEEIGNLFASIFQ